MADKPFEPEDPMALVGVDVPEGDADLMAVCLVEEFIRLGMSDAQLVAVFKSPFYAGANAIYLARGEEHVNTVIKRARAQWGYPRFTMTETDAGPRTEQIKDAGRSRPERTRLYVRIGDDPRTQRCDGYRHGAEEA